MAEEAIDYAAQEQARLDAYRRDRHAALLAAQRDAPAPANDASPAPANDGETNEDPEQYYRERTQARLTAKRQKAGIFDIATGGASPTEALSAAGIDEDDVKDIALLGFAILGFWAVWPPVALWSSYHLRLVGGKRKGVRFFGGEILTDVLGLLNEFCENTVIPGAKSATKGATGLAGQVAGAGKGGKDGFTKSMQDLAGGDMSALNPIQLLMLIVADIIVAFGLLTCSAFLLTIMVAGGFLVGACSTLPSICGGVLTTLYSVWHRVMSLF